MPDLPELTADFSHIYIDGKIYNPLILDKSMKTQGFNECVVTLPAKTGDDLDWSAQVSLAKNLVSQGSSILFEFDFGLFHEKLFTFESSFFNACAQAIDYFNQSILPDFSDALKGVVLFRGDLRFEERILWTQSHEDFYLEWLKEKKLSDSFMHQRVFAANIFSEYLHRLVSFFSDNLSIYALFDVSKESSLAFAAQLLSKERFEHLFIATKGFPFIIPSLAWEKGVSTIGYIGKVAGFKVAPLPPVALVCPIDECCTHETLEKLDVIIKELLEYQIPFKMVPEHFLTECWDEVKAIIVISSSISIQGRRKLLGFVAAGGMIYTAGEPLVFLDEEAQRPLHTQTILSDIESFEL